MMVLNLVYHEAQMTFTKFRWSINFFIIFSHISAGCQLIEKINVDLQSIIGSVNRVVEFPGSGLGRLITINSELNGAI